MCPSVVWCPGNVSLRICPTDSFVCVVTAVVQKWFCIAASFRRKATSIPDVTFASL